VGRVAEHDKTGRTPKQIESQEREDTELFGGRGDGDRGI
jgi:hypothetical protein